jgi:hypothetical protein
MEKKLCVKLVTYQNYRKMHGQKNIKLNEGTSFLYGFDDGT